MVIRDLEKEGKVPMGVYDHLKQLEQSDQSYHAIEEVSANNSSSLDSNQFRAIRQAQRTTGTIRNSNKPQSKPPTIKANQYIDSSSEEEDPYD